MTPHTFHSSTRAINQEYLSAKVDSSLVALATSQKSNFLLNRSEWPQLQMVSQTELYPIFLDLEPDLPEIHRSRKRARAKFDFHVVESGDIYFCESASATIFDKTGYRGPREHKRVFALRCRAIFQLALFVLSLALGQRAYRCGHIAIDIFRTIDDVVYGFHRDGEHFVGIYCVRRCCNGARTQLALDKAGTTIVFEDFIQPGDLLFFDDTRLFHNTTKLSDRDDGSTPERDVLIFTISGVL